MPNAVTKLGVLLVKEQSAQGTPESSLAAADAIETLEPPQMKYEHNPQSISMVAGGFDQDVSVPGIPHYDLTASVPVRSGGASDTGQYGKLLTLSAMTVTESPTDTFAYTFTSDESAYKEATAWCYTGTAATSGSYLHKFGNMIFAPKWTFTAGEVVKCDFTGQGAKAADPATDTQPSVTRSRVAIPAFYNLSTMTLNGDTDYQIISGEIDAGQEYDLTTDLGATYGRGRSLVTDRMIKFSFKVYQATNVNPFTAMSGASTGSLTVTYGSTPSQISFSMTYSQIEAIDESDENGVQTWDITGIAARNDFTHTIVTA